VAVIGLEDIEGDSEVVFVVTGEVSKPTTADITERVSNLASSQDMASSEAAGFRVMAVFVIIV